MTTGLYIQTSVGLFHKLIFLKENILLTCRQRPDHWQYIPQIFAFVGTRLRRTQHRENYDLDIQGLDAMSAFGHQSVAYSNRPDIKTRAKAAYGRLQSKCVKL